VALPARPPDNHKAEGTPLGHPPLFCSHLEGDYAGA